MSASTAPSEWQSSELADLADVNPESLAVSTSPDFKFRYIDLSSVSSGRIDWSLVRDERFRSAPSRARRKVIGGDVLFGTVRPALQSHGTIPQTNSEALVASTGFAVLRAKSGVADNRFLFHFVLSRLAAEQARRFEVGSNYPAVNEGDIRRFRILAPSLPEQRRIAEILDTLDEAIRKTEQIIAKLKQVKQGLLHDLLTRGIDENGELRDRERCPEQFMDSPLGVIPRAWHVAQLGALAEFVTSGSRGWAAYYSESGALFIRIGNLTREHINLRLDDMIFVQPPASSEGKRTRIEAGDVLLSITADLGIVGVAPDGIGEAYVNQHIALVRIFPQHACSRWVGHYLAGRQGKEQVRRLDDSGAKAGLNLPTVRGLLVPVPRSPAEQREIADRLDAIDQQIASEGFYGEKLKCLRRGMMDDLLSGRVRVTNLLGETAA